MIELLLLGILIMQIMTFHSNASSAGRYMKVFDFFIHRPTKYTERKTITGWRYLCRIKKIRR